MAANAYGQRLTYKIEWKGDSVGYLKAVHTKNSNRSVYEIESITKVRFLFMFTFAYTYRSVYNDHHLVSGRVTSRVNDREKRSTIEKSGTIYRINVDDEKSSYAKKITFSIPPLYFTEPIGRSSIFSERFGQVLSLKKTGSHRYELHKPDDRKNYYTYSGGRCTNVEIQNRMGTVYLQLVDVKP